MNIIKRFARWVLREDLRTLDVRIQNLQYGLKDRDKNYNTLGVFSEVETYYWDFNFSTIKIISEDAFDLISEFIIAQRNVLTDN